MPKNTGTKRVSAKKRASPQAKKKVEKVMHEYKEGKLHSGSKQGPKVKSRKQAIAIALSEAGVSTKKKRSKKTSAKKA